MLDDFSDDLAVEVAVELLVRCASFSDVLEVVDAIGEGNFGKSFFLGGIHEGFANASVYPFLGGILDFGDLIKDCFDFSHVFSDGQVAEQTCPVEAAFNGSFIRVCHLDLA